MKLGRMGALALIFATAVVFECAHAAPPTGDTKSQSDRPLEAYIGADPEKHPGKKVFDENCANCHEGQVPKAPQRAMFRYMAPQAILDTLNNGVMKDMAAHLDATQRQQVSEYLARVSLADYKAPPPPKMCKGKAKDFDLTKPPAPVGWGYDTRRFVPGDVAGLKSADVPKLKMKWAFAFPGALRARSQAVVAMGAVFVGSEDGTVYALDLATGCARWTSKAMSEVRTAIVVEPWEKGSKPARNPRLFFGDIFGRVYAIDALTGEALWRVRPEEHSNATITGTPVIAGDTVYVPISSFETMTTTDPNYVCCTFRGSLVALDAKDGHTKWQHYTVENVPAKGGKTLTGRPMFGPSGAPVWTTPTLDPKRNAIYHGSGENYSSPPDKNSDAIFAVDTTTGKRLWRVQLTPNDAWNNSCFLRPPANCPSENGPDVDLAASVMLIDLGDGKQALVAGTKSGQVTAVDPDNKGKILWRAQVGRGSNQGGVHFGMAAEGTRLYVPIYDAKYTSDGGVYKDYGFPGIHAVDAKTGKILWRHTMENRCAGREYCEPGVSAAVTAIPDVVFAGHVDGWMRAYDGATGKLVWEVDTTVPVKTVNGSMAHGGSMSGPGAAVADGYVLFESGYNFALKMPGNVLYAYTVDGK